MNIIANAIDELNQGYSFKQTQCFSSTITIHTEVNTDTKRAIIQIKDKEPGMTEAVKAQVFEYLFTTKPVG